MRTLHLTIPYKSKTTKYTIYPSGDWHLGARGCHEGKLKAMLKRVEKDPFARLLLMGDLGDFIGRNDPRFESEQLADWIITAKISALLDIQVDYIVELLWPVKDKILGALCGNHEEKVKKYYGTDVHGRLCHALGIEDLTYSALLVLHFVRNRNRALFTIYAHHGHGGGRKIGSKANRLHDTSGYVDADIFLLGHVHERGWSQAPVLGADPREDCLRAEERLFGLTGTYLETYAMGSSNYGETAGYPPTSLGGISFVITPEHMTVEPKMEPVAIRRRILHE